MEILLDLDSTETFSTRKARYIRLITNNYQETRYCFSTIEHNHSEIIGYTLLENPTESAFKNSISDDDILTFVMYCQPVESLVLSYIDSKYGYLKQIELLSESLN